MKEDMEGDGEELDIGKRREKEKMKKSKKGGETVKECSKEKERAGVICEGRKREWERGRGGECGVFAYQVSERAIIRMSLSLSERLIIRVFITKRKRRKKMKK